MAPTLAKLFHRAGWVYEEKYDGCRQLLFRCTVERGLGLRTAKELLRRGRERSTSPFHDFRLHGVTWLERHAER